MPDLENQEWWVKKLFDGMPTHMVQAQQGLGSGGKIRPIQQICSRDDIVVMKNGLLHRISVYNYMTLIRFISLQTGQGPGVQTSIPS